MTGLSKSRLLSYRQCPRRLWLHVHRPDLEQPDSGASARMAAGHQVGEVARRLYPDGALIDTPDLAQALQETRRLLAEPPRPLFESTFQHDGLLVRADLLLPAEAGWRLVEVKSSTEVKGYHLDDAAVQAHVLEQAGVTVASVELAHIDNSFVYSGAGNYAGLFKHEELTHDIEPLKGEVPNWVIGARRTLAGAEPDAVPGERCATPFDCPFRAHCAGSDAAEGFPPELLPRAGKLAQALRAEGYTDLRQVPAGRLGDARHRRVWQASVTGQAVLEPQARDVLADLDWPRYYLDFETVAPAVPLWAGTRPYMQVPFQWSCHIEAAPGELRHAAFLAEATEDPRRRFAETLLHTVGPSGAVMVYNAAFERGRLSELAATFPDLAPGLDAVAARIFDLLPLARTHYYHPAMRGSWSLKALLPTIAPELHYGELEVGDGGQAQQAFLEIIDAATPAERRSALREALLAYCQRDTLAMVRVTHHFEGR